jgi:hypothetical protein
MENRPPLPRASFQGRLSAFDPRHGDDRRGALAKAGKGR